MATVAERIAALDAAIATVEKDAVSGIRQLQYLDRAVSYGSTTERLEVLKQLRAERAALVRRRSKQTLLVASTGF
jgi:hypothetical protein